MSGDRQHGTPVLIAPGVRVVLVVLAVALVFVSYFYAEFQRTKTIAVSPCRFDSAQECVVEVSAEANPTLIIAWIVFAAGALLLALLGQIPVLELAGNRLAGRPIAGSLSSNEVDRRAPVEEPDVETSLPDTTASELWTSLPAPVRAAAEEYWGEAHNGASLVRDLREVRRRQGKGSHAFFLRAKTGSTDEWIRITNSGRGRTKPLAGPDDDPGDLPQYR